jgi:hypothetical protein
MHNIYIFVSSTKSDTHSTLYDSLKKLSTTEQSALEQQYRQTGRVLRAEAIASNTWASCKAKALTAAYSSETSKLEILAKQKVNQNLQATLNY